MSERIDLVGGYLNADTVESLSRSIGADTRQTESAIGALLPTLLGGLAKGARAA